MGEDRVILGPGLQTVNQITVKVPIVTPRLLAVRSPGDVLTLEHGHQEGDGVEHPTFDACFLLDLVNEIEHVIGVLDLDVDRKLAPKRKLLEVGIEVRHLLLVLQLHERCGLARIGLAHHQHDVLVLAHKAPFRVDTAWRPRP